MLLFLHVKFFKNRAVSMFSCPFIIDKTLFLLYALLVFKELKFGFAGKSMVESKNLKLKLGLCGLALTSFLAINAHSTVHADTVQDNANNQNAITWDSDQDDSQVVKEDSNQEELSQSVQTQAPAVQKQQVVQSARPKQSAVQSAPVQNKAVQPVQKQTTVQPKQWQVAVSNVSSTVSAPNRAERSTVRQSNVETSTVNRLKANTVRNNQLNANLKVANVNATANQGVRYTNVLTADEYNDWSKISDDRLKDMTFATKLWREDPNRGYHSDAGDDVYVPFPDYKTYSGSNGSDVVYLKGSQLVNYGVSLNDLRQSAIHSYKQDILHDYSDGRLYRAPYAESSDYKFDWGYVLTPRYVSNCAQILQNLAKNVKFTSSTDPDLYNLQGKDFSADVNYDNDTFADELNDHTYGLSFEVANDSRYNYSRSVAYPDTTIERSSSSAQPSVQYNPVRITNPSDNTIIAHFVKTNGQSADISDQTIDLTKLGQGTYNLPSGYVLSNPHYTTSETTHNANFTNSLTNDEYSNWTKTPDDRLKNMTFAVQLFVLSDDSWTKSNYDLNWDEYYMPDPDRDPNCAKSAIVYLKGSQLLDQGFTVNDLRQSAEFGYIRDVLPTFKSSDRVSDNETNSYRSLTKYYGPVGVSSSGHLESTSESWTLEPANGYFSYYGYIMEPKYKSNSQQILQNLANNVTFKNMYAPDTGTVNGVFDLKSKLSDPNYKFAVVFSTANPKAVGSKYNYNMPVHDGYTFQDNSGQVKSVVGNHVNIAVTKPQNVDPNSSNCKRQAQRIIHVTFPNGVKPKSYDSITDSAGNKLTLDSNNDLTQTVTFTRSVTVDGLTGATLNQTSWQQHGAINAVTLPDIPGYTMVQSK